MTLLMIFMKHSAVLAIAVLAVAARPAEDPRAAILRTFD